MSEYEYFHEQLKSNDPTLSKAQIKKIIEFVTEKICHYCYEGSRDCQCWNDE